MIVFLLFIGVGKRKKIRRLSGAGRPLERRWLFYGVLSHWATKSRRLGQLIDLDGEESSINYTRSQSLPKQREIQSLAPPLGEPTTFLLTFIIADPGL